MTENFDKKADSWDKEQYRINRAKAVADVILKQVPLNKDMSVMDFGCGTGLLGFHFTPLAGEVVFVDSSAGMLAQVKAKGEQNGVCNISAARLEELPGDRKFNLITNLMVFHHIDNFDETFHSLNTRLYNSGYIIFCDLEKEDGSFHTPGAVPHNGFDRNKIRKLFTNCSLNIVFEDVVFNNVKIINGQKREYPVFLIIGKKR